MADKKSGGIADTLKTIVYALLLAGIIRTLFFQPFWIPSGSMKPTLLVGDFLFVNKMAYGYSKYSCPFAMCPFEGRIFGSEPERGDVVVFKHPTTGADYIKRVVGLPGEQIQVKDAVLYIDGQKIPQQPDGIFVEPAGPQGSMRSMPRCTNGAVPLGEDCEKERAIESLPGGTDHAILNIGDGGKDNTPVFTVPDGHYFFMGDNRDNSVDSRFPRQFPNGVGFVPHDLLIGRADRVIFSSAGARVLFFWTWRGDRFFKRIE